MENEDSFHLHQNQHYMCCNLHNAFESLVVLQKKELLHDEPSYLVCGVLALDEKREEKQQQNQPTEIFLSNAINHSPATLIFFFSNLTIHNHNVSRFKMAVNAHGLFSG